MDVFKMNPLGKRDGDAFTRISFRVDGTNCWRIDKWARCITYAIPIQQWHTCGKDAIHAQRA